jgi:peptide/nickel transport system substrate-binding protein
VSLVVVLAGCAAPPAARPPAEVGSGGAAAVQAPSGPKRITVAVLMDPPQLISKFERLLPGASDVEVMVTSGFAIPDDRGVLQPILAEAVPTVENGLWVLSPDGRMETTWKLRRNLRWHDGTPFTAEDVVFTGRLGRDPDLVTFRHPGFELVESIDATDPNTVVVRWREPYVAADTLFGTTIDISRITVPLPKHLLETAYQGDKVAFTQLPYWSEEFVGTGPFRLREWARGSHAVLEAFDGFALGRPPIDRIEVKFIPDGNTLIANVLAGAADATLGRGLSLDQTLEAERQWREGKQRNGGPGAWFAVFPQFQNPDPAIIGNVAFRRALMHGMDRQQMADTLMYGLVPVAHVIMSPVAAGYKEIEPQIVRYDYNPRRATEMLQGVGLTAGADGALRDAEGRQPSVEIRTTPGDLMVKSNETVADQWRRLGLQVQTVTFSQTQQRDLEYRATRSGFEFSRRGVGMENLTMFQTKELSLASNRYSGKNLAGYSNPEMDSLVDRYFATVPQRERMQMLAQTLRHMSDQLPILTLFYDTESSLVSNRIVNLEGKPAESTGAWNAHLWDLRP